MKKLTMSRETLRTLDPEHLRRAGGGLFNKCDGTSQTNDYPYDQPCGDTGGDIDTQVETSCINGEPQC